MNKKYLRGIVEKADNGSYRVLASTSSIDRQGDSIDQSGWDLKNFLKNPVMLWAHKYDELPVAKAIATKVTDKGLEMSFEFASESANPKAQQIKELYDEGFLNAVSVGFIPKERNGNVITKQELLEVSFVPVPANQDALALSVKSIEANSFLSDIDRKELIEKLEKGAVADELDAVEAYEAKWEKWDEVCEVLGALWDVYFAEETSVDSFSTLLTEAIGLLQKVAADGGADDDTTEEAKTALKALMIGKVSAASAKLFIQKIGARHSADTKKALQGAIDHNKSAIAVLEDMMSSEDGTSEESTTESVDLKTEEEVGSEIELRSLLITRKLLRGDQTGTQSTLERISSLIKEKRIEVSK